jgi:hypothetical protein
MALRPTDDNENRLGAWSVRRRLVSALFHRRKYPAARHLRNRAGSVSDLVWPFFSSRWSQFFNGPIKAHTKKAHAGPSLMELLVN